MGHSYSRLIFFLALGGCPKAADPPVDPPPTPTPKLAVDAAAPSPTLPPPPGAVEVRLLGKPGAFQVAVIGDGVDLSRDVIVEREADGGHPALTIQLIETCAGADAGACVSIPARTTFTPVAWTGMSCDSQCPRPCRANAYLGPGTFRFVVKGCDGRRRWESSWFQLPASKL
jgi:hypothetical protein